MRKLEETIVHAEDLPLACPPVASLSDEDVKLRVALVRALVARDLAGGRIKRLCVGVILQGRTLDPPPSLLRAISLSVPVQASCGCAAHEEGTRVVLLPEVKVIKDGSLEVGSPFGSAHPDCKYKAQREKDEWRLSSECTVR